MDIRFAFAPALLRQQDFVQGVQWGREYYQDEHERGVATQKEIATLMQEEFSAQTILADLDFDRAYNVQPLPDIQRVGFVVGWLLMHAERLAALPQEAPLEPASAKIIAWRPRE